MQHVAAALVAADVPAEVRPYYQRVKAEELLCLFLAELVKRGPHAEHSPLSSLDVRQLYHVRAQLLQDLGQPPRLSALAQSAAWSESKLKRLFKQVFGTPVYQYYQAARLQEAVRLLSTQPLSVSEVGYRLGFQNLSHFTKLFARYTGSRPKQFSKRHPRPTEQEGASKRHLNRPGVYDFSDQPPPAEVPFDRDLIAAWQPSSKPAQARVGVFPYLFNNTPNTILPAAQDFSWQRAFLASKQPRHFSQILKNSYTAWKAPFCRGFFVSFFKRASIWKFDELELAIKPTFRIS